MGFGGLSNAGGTSTAGSTKEGFQWSILVLVAASEQEKQKGTPTPPRLKNE